MTLRDTARGVEEKGAHVRQASLEDIVAVQEVAGICWRHTYRDILSTEAIKHFLSRAYSDFALRQAQARGGLLVLEAKGKKRSICGYLRLSAENSAGYLGALYLLPEYQGQGYGRLSWEAARAWFLKRGASSVTLTVAAQNSKARDFYRRLGFEEIAISTGVVGGERLEEITCRLCINVSNEL
jgi:ribosomal protein S18 acetylase RimI-like enzyme